MTCTVCGNDIGYGENYMVMESGDIVCMENTCRTTYMTTNLTEAEKTEYFALCDVAEVAAYAKENGLTALPPWELELMLEWYESGDCMELENEDEPERYSEWDHADFEYDCQCERVS